MPRKIRNPPKRNCCMLSPGQGEYTHRYNRVANIVHQELVMRCGLSRGQPMPYYKYEPQSESGNSSYKLYYDKSIITYHAIHNRPTQLYQTKLGKKQTRQMYRLPAAATFIAPSPRILTSCRLERRDYKNMATKKGLYYTFSTTYNGYYPKQITRECETA